MALITVSGEPGCDPDPVARSAARRLGFEFLNEARIEGLIRDEFSAETAIPERAWPSVAASILARLSLENHLIFAGAGAEMLFKRFPRWLRLHLAASEPRRIGDLMISRQVDRETARQELDEIEKSARDRMKRRYGRAAAPAGRVDLLLSCDTFDPEQLAALVESAARAIRLPDQGLLTPQEEAEMQFPLRMRLARYGIRPPGKAKLKKAAFGHPSEQIFANLLDFYRIDWEYEGRSFPIQWDKQGRVTEAFTPDFYLPEFDLYVELTTMKQANVTRKNRKIKLVRAMYPHVNIQVFYQKDIQNLIFKHGIVERPLPA